MLYLLNRDPTKTTHKILIYLHQFNLLDSQLISKGKVLKLSKAQLKDSGIYECIARNGLDEDLRKIIQIKVRGK